MIFRTFILCFCFLASFVYVAAQEDVSQARKFDELGRMIPDSEMTRLDAFAVELSNNQKLRGYIIGYIHPDALPGHLLRKIYGYQNYLVNMRGVNPNLIKVAIGESETRQPTELWLVPNNASPPKPSKEKQFNPKTSVQFDEVFIGNGCEPEFTIDLYELNDGLIIYADVLRSKSNLQLSIIIYPKRGNKLSSTANIATQAKNLLVKDFDIQAGRITTKVINSRRKCMTVEIWIKPSVPKKDNI
jgi:hypothetical protein